MKKTLLVIFLVTLLQSSIVFGAPVIFLESQTIMPMTTSVDIGLFIYTDDSSPVSSATFTNDPIAGFNLTNVSAYALDNWIPTVALPKFGSADFGWPGKPIESDTLFATLSFSFAENFFKFGDKVTIGFSFIELADNDANAYDTPIEVLGGTVSCVPIPGAVFLFGSGLLGLIGIGRKRMKKS